MGRIKERPIFRSSNAIVFVEMENELEILVITFLQLCGFWDLLEIKQIFSNHSFLDNFFVDHTKSEIGSGDISNYRSAISSESLSLKSFLFDPFIISFQFSQIFK